MLCANIERMERSVMKINVKDAKSRFSSLLDMVKEGDEGCHFTPGKGSWQGLSGREVR